MTTDTTTAMRMALEALDGAYTLSIGHAATYQFQHQLEQPHPTHQAILDKATAAIAALREAIERDGWQPIETMPRTGRFVLMWSRNAGYFAGNWPQGCAAGDWHKISGDWRGGSHWRAQDATHWRPLPDAPKD